jgi:hypothetical protein
VTQCQCPCMLNSGCAGDDIKYIQVTTCKGLIEGCPLLTLPEPAIRPLCLHLGLCSHTGCLWGCPGSLISGLFCKVVLAPIRLAIPPMALRMQQFSILLGVGQCIACLTDKL